MQGTMLVSAICLLVTIAGANAECHVRDVCCQQGGYCGDPIFDECQGSWDYRTRCNPSFRTCCFPTTPITTSTTQTTTTVPSTPTTPYTGPSTVPPSTTPPPTTTSGPPLPNDCGRRPLGSVERSREEYIVGGVEAAPHSWPWAVSIELDYFGWNDWVHHCGGSIINERFILTAAHCLAKSGVSDPKLFRVLIGLHNQKQLDGVKMITAEKMIWHEDYSTSAAGSPNDIALLKLSEPIAFSEKASPVCLPSSFGQNFTSHSNCYIIGWGVTQGTGNEDVLNESPIEVITNELCDDKWESGSGRVNLIKDSHICAGNGVPGTCNGDSGGPLLCKVGDQWVQAGATSFGAAGCTADNAPDVYTRLSHHLDWIHQKITNN